MGQLHEKEFELELKTADNRILQEQLQTRMSEIKELQDSIAAMQQKSIVPGWVSQSRANGYFDASHSNGARVNRTSFSGDDMDADTVDDLESGRLRGNLRETASISSLQSQVLKQASDIEKLQQEKDILAEEKEGLQIQGQKLAEEASYAKELASAAAVELKNLAEEVKKLSLQNSQLADDLVTVQEAAFSRLSSRKSVFNGGHVKGHTWSDRQISGGHTIRVKDGERCFVDVDNEYTDIDSWELDPEDMKRELHARKEREVVLETALAEKEQLEADLRRKLEDAKQREANLENDLAGMWVVVAKLKKERGTPDEPLEMEVDDCSQKNSANDLLICNGLHDSSQEKVQKKDSLKKEPDKQEKLIEELQTSLEYEKLKTTELQSAVSRLKGDDLESLHYSTLEDLQNLHMEALTKICQAKARNRELDREKERGLSPSSDQHHEESNGHICKVCFEAPTAAVLLPCRHFCLCKPCAVACTECPLCRSGIADRIITFTS
ncbi:hypothetical protein L7F22_057662 [Adiantum nelumboides]|nr:hypothetical protein [Adiantum nelumboides]